MPAGPPWACGSPPDGPFVVAVDLGVDRVVAARVGLGGVVRERAETIISGSEAWQVGATVAGLVRQVVAQAPATSPLVGIGISVPGMVRHSDGLIRLAPNLDWHDVSFGGIVLAALGVDVPVSLANDADLGALAEHQRGAGVGVEDLIYVSGFVGVGAGVISGGHRLEGAGGYAGEIGHLRFNPDGKPCHCGNLGCWETEVGAYAIAEAIRCPKDRVHQLGEVLDAFEEAPRELRAIGSAIGQGLASIVNLFNPQVVVMGGYFDAIYTLVRAEIDEGLADRALPAALESVLLSAAGPGPGLGAPRGRRDGLRAALRRPRHGAGQRDPGRRGPPGGMSPAEYLGRVSDNDFEDQLTSEDTLDDPEKEVEDELDRGSPPPDRWSAGQGFGNTAFEEATGESLDQRVAQEEPEADPYAGDRWRRRGPRRRRGRRPARRPSGRS